MDNRSESAFVSRTTATMMPTGILSPLAAPPEKVTSTVIATTLPLDAHGTDDTHKKLFAEQEQERTATLSCAAASESCEGTATTASASSLKTMEMDNSIRTTTTTTTPSAPPLSVTALSAARMNADDDEHSCSSGASASTRGASECASSASSRFADPKNNGDCSDYFSEEYYSDQDEQTNDHDHEKDNSCSDNSNAIDMTNDDDEEDDDDDENGCSTEFDRNRRASYEEEADHEMDDRSGEYEDDNDSEDSEIEYDRQQHRNMGNRNIPCNDSENSEFEDSDDDHEEEDEFENDSDVDNRQQHRNMDNRNNTCNDNENSEFEDSDDDHEEHDGDKGNAFDSDVSSSTGLSEDKFWGQEEGNDNDSDDDDRCLPPPLSCSSTLLSDRPNPTRLRTTANRSTASASNDGKYSRDDDAVASEDEDGKVSKDDDQKVSKKDCKKVSKVGDKTLSNGDKKISKGKKFVSKGKKFVSKGNENVSQGDRKVSKADKKDSKDDTDLNDDGSDHSILSGNPRPLSRRRKSVPSSTTAISPNDKNHSNDIEDDKDGNPFPYYSDRLRRRKPLNNCLASSSPIEKDTTIEDQDGDYHISPRSDRLRRRKTRNSSATSSHIEKDATKVDEDDDHHSSLSGRRGKTVKCSTSNRNEKYTTKADEDDGPRSSLSDRPRRRCCQAVKSSPISSRGKFLKEDNDFVNFDDYEIDVDDDNDDDDDDESFHLAARTRRTTVKVETSCYNEKDSEEEEEEDLVVDDDDPSGLSDHPRPSCRRRKTATRRNSSRNKTDSEDENDANDSSLTGRNKKGSKDEDDNKDHSLTGRSRRCKTVKSSDGNSTSCGNDNNSKDDDDGDHRQPSPVSKRSRRSKNTKRQISQESEDEIETGFKARKKTDLVWLKQYKKLVSFYRKMGHLDLFAKDSPYMLDREKKTSKEFGSFRRWIKFQRTQYHNQSIPNHRFKALQAINFRFHVQKTIPVDWDIMFERLVKFKKENGHTNVVCWNSKHTYKDTTIFTPEFKRLSKWVSTQRQKYQLNKMTERQIRKLEGIGFQWRLLERKRFEDLCNWNELYERLSIYKDKNGHTNVSCNYSKDPMLGKFVNNQRRKYVKGELSSDKINALSKLGFRWSNVHLYHAEQRWEKRFAELLEFHKTFGHFLVPSPPRYQKDSYKKEKVRFHKYDKLSHWVSYTRHARRHGTLPRHRFERLLKIGFFKISEYSGPTTDTITTTITSNNGVTTTTTNTANGTDDGHETISKRVTRSSSSKINVACRIGRGASESQLVSVKREAEEEAENDNNGKKVRSIENAKKAEFDTKKAELENKTGTSVAADDGDGRKSPPATRRRSGNRKRRFCDVVDDAAIGNDDDYDNSDSNNRRRRRKIDRSSNKTNNKTNSNSPIISSRNTKADLRVKRRDGKKVDDNDNQGDDCDVTDYEHDDGDSYYGDDDVDSDYRDGDDDGDDEGCDSVCDKKYDNFTVRNKQAKGPLSSDCSRSRSSNKKNTAVATKTKNNDNDKKKIPLNTSDAGSCPPYRDFLYSSEAEVRTIIQYREPKCERLLFPQKVSDMLRELEFEKNTDVVSWQKHGRSFVVHDESLFVRTIIPRFFVVLGYKSFQNNLNNYGFKRSNKKDEYFHELFLKARPDLCKLMRFCDIRYSGENMSSMREIFPKTPNTRKSFNAFPLESSSEKEKTTTETSEQEFLLWLQKDKASHCCVKTKDCEGDNNSNENITRGKHGDNNDDEGDGGANANKHHSTGKDRSSGEASTDSWSKKVGCGRKFSDLDDTRDKNEGSDDGVDCGQNREKSKNYKQGENCKYERKEVDETETQDDGNYRVVFEVRWTERYKELIEFQRKYGHYRVPDTHPSDYRKLGMWVRLQRKMYKKKTLRPDRVALLEKIDFQFTLRENFDDLWKRRIAELRDHKEKFGHCRVDRKLQPELGSWVAHQRRKYLKRQMIASRARVFRELGIK